MLDKPVEEIVYENGKVVGVKSGGEVSSSGLSLVNVSSMIMFYRLDMCSAGSKIALCSHICLFICLSVCLSALITYTKLSLCYRTCVCHCS